MDAKSPAAADPVSRPSAPLPPSARPDRLARTLRGAGIVVAGVGVAALTAAACVLSFEDLRAFAITGEADRRLAYLYPAAFDALLVIAMIGVLLLRGGRWPARLQAGVVLTLLFLTAATAEVATATRTTVDVRQAAVVVAVVPWVMLAMALWLWLLLIKHAAARRAAADAVAADRVRDIVPFSEAEVPTAEYPAHRGLPARPAADPARPTSPAVRPVQPVRPVPPAADPAQPVLLSHAEVVLDPQAAPPLESAPHHDLPSGVPVVGPTAAPETPEVEELPERPVAPERPASASSGRPVAAERPAPESSEQPAAAERPASASSERPVAAKHPASASSERPATPEPAAVPEPAPLPAKPVRWGDLVRPRQGDLLVHPPRAAVQDEAAQDERPAPDGRVSERVETWDAGAEPSQAGAEPPQRSAGPSQKKDRKRRGEVGDRDVDTQPIPAMTGETPKKAPDGSSPDPAHGVELADREENLPQSAARPEPQTEQAGRTKQTRRTGRTEQAGQGGQTGQSGQTDGGSDPIGEDTDTPPPSMRVRSTPTPPEE
ncbi:DUF2637 domain-containing protein [Streptosporangium sp. NBC_01756]|uniref:DUF2637 domain-containing protein n=1 Tax=Streptosporangium sp. NBC_01756 TaxID=2975950 RepID=UPI002DDA0143|nr:DUF2637 domain-containing protein [Streptosporangium sp. NBC_01756]WSC83366.1 DUF2637 domain-containing protein [Streptosporangium sp. NBC_01756]